MPRSSLESQISSDHGAAWRAVKRRAHRLNQFKVMSAIGTLPYGSAWRHVARCVDWWHEHMPNNSCRNRTAQNARRLAPKTWLAAREAETAACSVIFTWSSQLP